MFIAREIYFSEQGRSNKRLTVRSHIIPGNYSINTSRRISGNYSIADIGYSVQQMTKIFLFKHIVDKPVFHSPEINWQQHQARDGAVNIFTCGMCFFNLRFEILITP